MEQGTQMNTELAKAIKTAGFKFAVGGGQVSILRRCGKRYTVAFRGSEGDCFAYLLAKQLGQV